MNRKLGLKGEELAVAYLSKRGYKIIERNYYTRYGELDIICIHKNAIVFVEVKTRSSNKFGFPEESITKTKIKHLRQAAVMFLNTCTKHYREIRFDVIAILITGNNKEINHIKNAF